MTDLLYLDDLDPNYTTVDRPLWWHNQGLQQTTSGYGNKLTSARMVRLTGSKRLYRVYVTQWSNAGTAWVMIQGKRYIVW